MTNILINTFKVSFTEDANAFIYFLRRIPVLGKKIPERLYQHTESKIFLGILYEIFGTVGRIFKKLLYLGLLILLPAYLITRNSLPLLPVFLHLFFFFNVVMGPLMHSTVFEGNPKQAFDMIILMKAEAREYYLGEMIFSHAADLVYFVLPTTVMGAFVGFSPGKAILFLLEMVAARWIGEGLQLLVYEKTGKVLIQNILYMIIVIGGGLALAYGLPLLKITIGLSLMRFNFLVLVLAFVLGAAAFHYLWHYPGYTAIAKSLLKRENVFVTEALTAELEFADVRIDEGKTAQSEQSRGMYDSKQGFEYLNALFFFRHRRIMVRPVFIRLVVIGTVFLTALCLEIFIPGTKDGLMKVIQESTPALVFLMYVMSTGERICRAMFYNCDASLLRYGFYRERKVILSNFTSRLKRTIQLNIIPAFAVCFAIAGIMAAGGYGSRLVSVIPIFLCILCLSCFFSIHHLFVYYVIQPYTTNSTIKSPLYRFVNFVIYAISYGSLQIKTSSYFFTLGVIGTTILYMTIALIITYRAAPKTFRLH